MKKRTAILSILLGVFMVLTLNVGQVKAASKQDIVDYAMQFIGVPYADNGNTPSGFDCSGFVQYVYKNCAGIYLPRTSYQQYEVGSPVSRNNLQPGDLVFPEAHLGHVAIYVGDGQIIHSPEPGDQVRVAKMYNFYGAKRIISCPYVEPASKYATPIRSRYVVITEPQVIRNAPCYAASVVRTLNHGEVIDVYKTYEYDGVWWSLIARGVKQQWIRSAYIKEKAPQVNSNASPIKKRYKVNVSSLQVRSYPDKISPVVATLKKGDVVDIYAEHKGWYLIARGVKQQWVPINSLSK
ncbi:NlpC/P60 family protein [Clostridium rectalis]|uniref:NlpC/P60 family protein n=1 Tax=Clostridium rectalis TaxID=2040295 RepID=UPI0013DE6CAD|nr:NlpC/P60 family protein [Clostridium rectalis]